MTDTKPTLPEQIEWAEVLIKCDSGIAPAVLASLKELAAIKSQPVPVEPKIYTKTFMRGSTMEEHDVVLMHDYDTLLSALQVAQMERTAERERGDQWETTATNILGRAEKAEAERNDWEKKP